MGKSAVNSVPRSCEDAIFYDGPSASSRGLPPISTGLSSLNLFLPSPTTSDSTIIFSSPNNSKEAPLAMRRLGNPHRKLPPVLQTKSKSLEHLKVEQDYPDPPFTAGMVSNNHQEEQLETTIDRLKLLALQNSTINLGENLSESPTKLTFLLSETPADTSSEASASNLEPIEKSALFGRSDTIEVNYPRASPRAPSRATTTSTRSYAPILPSALSSSHVPDDMGQMDWNTFKGDGLSTKDQKNSRNRDEFPFPPSPQMSRFPNPSREDSTNTIRAPPRPPIRGGDKNRSLSTDTVGSSASHSSTYGSSSNTRNVDSSPSPAQSTARSPLTPPECYASFRTLSSATDFAWNELGLSNVGIGGYNVRSSGSTGEQQDKRPDLMSLESTMVSPISHGSIGKGFSGATSTPTENTRRVANRDLMSSTSGGHYGPATREKLSLVLSEHLKKVPLLKGEDVVHIVEYGALHSISASMIPLIVSSLAKRHKTQRLQQNLPEDDEESISFHITHSDIIGSDFRALSQQLETSSHSYMNHHWQINHDPVLSNRVFSNYSSRPFGARIAPKNTISVGFSAMALHWLNTERKFRGNSTAIAHGELMAFLSARAHEFKSGGLLVLAFICRCRHDSVFTRSRGSSSESSKKLNTSPSTSYSPLLTPLSRNVSRERSTSSPGVETRSHEIKSERQERDIWAYFTSILGKAIQRLVSTQLLLPSVARQLLALPIHSRTPEQSRAVLQAMEHAWTVEAEEVTIIPHPAWNGVQHETISPASYIDHTIQLLKVFWESEMRSILRETLSRSACEWALESIFEVAREKMEEEGPLSLELEVQVIALRRR